jgi:hypothetical protein
LVNEFQGVASQSWCHREDRRKISSACDRAAERMPQICQRDHQAVDARGCPSSTGLRAM